MNYKQSLFGAERFHDFPLNGTKSSIEIETFRITEMNRCAFHCDLCKFFADRQFDLMEYNVFSLCNNFKHIRFRSENIEIKKHLIRGPPFRVCDI